MMTLAIYGAIIETLILVAVVFEAWVSWKNLQEKQRRRIKATVSKLLGHLGVQ